MGKWEGVWKKEFSYTSEKAPLSRCVYNTSIQSGQSWVSFKRATLRQFLVLLHFYFSEDYSGQGFLVCLIYLQWLKQSPRDLRWLCKMCILYGKVILNFQEALKKIRLFSDRFWGGDYNIIKYIKIRCCQGERHPSQHWILNLHRCNLHVTYLKLHMHSFMNTFWTSQCVLSFTLHTQSCVWWHHACSNIRHE